MRRLQLRCKADKRKGLWLLAKANDTYAKFMKEDYENEARYINALNDEEKVWLNTFLQAYYHQSKPAMDKLKFPIMLRRERYNQHRGSKNDIFNKQAKVDLGKKVNIDNDNNMFDMLVLEEDSTAVVREASKRKVNRYGC